MIMVECGNFHGSIFQYQKLKMRLHAEKQPSPIWPGNFFVLMIVIVVMTSLLVCERVETESEKNCNKGGEEGFHDDRDYSRSKLLSYFSVCKRFALA